MDEKKKESRRLQKEADGLAKEAERSELSLHELTTLRQLEARLGVGMSQTVGPMMPAMASQEDINQPKSCSGCLLGVC